MFKSFGTGLEALDNHLSQVINVSWNFAKRLTTRAMEEQNALVGLASESGELLDIGKKRWFHEEKPEGFHRDKMLSEIGDIYFYLLKAQELFNITTEEALAYNRKKLESRHPELGKVDVRFGADAIKG